LVGVQVVTAGLAPWRIRTSSTPEGVFGQSEVSATFRHRPCEVMAGKTAGKTWSTGTARADSQPLEEGLRSAPPSNFMVESALRASGT